MMMARHEAGSSEFERPNLANPLDPLGVGQPSAGSRPGQPTGAADEADADGRPSRTQLMMEQAREKMPPALFPVSCVKRAH